MPLVTFADLRAPAKSAPSRTVYELVAQRIHDDARPMPQAPAARLSAEEAEVLDGWVARGALRGSLCEAGASPSDAGEPLVPTLPCAAPTVTMAPGTPFVMPEVSDLYVTYGFDVAAGSLRHITAIVPVVQNTKIVHHMLLFQADRTVSPIPTPVALAGVNTRLLFAWAPGGKAFVLPPDVGFPEEGTAHYVVQIHYNNLAALHGETDASGFATCTGAPRLHEADVMAFGTEKIAIPPRAKLTKTCTLDVPASAAGLTMFAAMPHQHRLGTSIATTLVRGGVSTDLGHATPWDFQNQQWMPVSGVTQTGDKVVTRCAWNNTTSEPVSFGERTEDEMCFAITLYYPRLTTPGWAWDIPARSSTCVDE
jgi:hypothetical protein